MTKSQAEPMTKAATKTGAKSSAGGLTFSPLRAGLAAALIAILVVLFNGGSLRIVDLVVNSIGGYYEFETSQERAIAKHGKIVASLETPAERNRARDESVEPLLKMMAEAETICFEVAIILPGRKVPTTGCFYDEATDAVYIDVQLLSEYLASKDNARSLALVYEVASAYAAFVQSRMGVPAELEREVGGPLYEQRKGLDRDTLAGRIATRYFGVKRSPEKVTVKLTTEALRLVRTSHAKRAHHRGKWEFPEALKHAPLERRARWFQTGILEPDTDHRPRLFGDPVGGL